MGFEAWLTLGLTGLIFLALIRDTAPPDIVFLGAMVVLLLFGVIDTEEAFSGFSNPGVITIAMLFIVTTALQETGLMEAAGQRLLGRAKTETGALARLSAVVMPLSAFLNNTPVVAMFMPLTVAWCRRNRISPSRLLMPIAFLATLGGACTLIGTSTNLVVDGMMKARGISGLTGRPGIGLFELSLIGVPAATIGAIYLMTLGRALLPDRKELLEQLGEQRREYLVEMHVQPGCRLIGQTVEQASLRSLPGLFLIEIERDGITIAPVGPDDVIEANDRLIFTGVVSSIVELEQIPGLVPAADPSYEITPAQQRGRLLCEAVISSRSSLIGKTIREADFRAAYGAAVVAVCRDGHRIPRKLGDVRLRPGDTLLLQTRRHFPRAHRNDPGFYLVTDVPDWRPLRRDRLGIALALFVLLLVMMTTGWVDEPVAAAACAVAMIAAGCVSTSDARQSIDWSTLVTVAAAFSVGKGLEASGAAAGVTGGLFSLVGNGLSPWAALAIIYFTTWIVTEMLTNNAAAVLMFPFAIETAERFGVSPLPFLIALTLGASNGFATPIGYQTYMMVYGPGGYKFTDFIRVGLPLSLVLGVVATLLIPFWWPFTSTTG